MPIPTRVDFADLPDERWDYPARGSIRFRTLISAPATNTNELVFGVAMLSAGDTFVVHSHPHPKVCFGLEGNVLIDGIPRRLAPGVALFIPGGAMHGVPDAAGPMKWFYSFAADSFADIPYHFPREITP